jgi:NAD(P)-dependent dehydrogenase (short-subunit alcohol dehydrogenase family)
VRRCISSELAGQVAIATGGGRGIGRVIAPALVAPGAAVAVVARTTDQLAETVAELTDEQKSRLSLANAHAVHTAAQATEQVYRLAGSTAIYQTSPIERCFRDAQTAPADFIVGSWVYESAGRVRLGFPWTTPTD